MLQKYYSLILPFDYLTNLLLQGRPTHRPEERARLVHSAQLDVVQAVRLREADDQGQQEGRRIRGTREEVQGVGRGEEQGGEEKKGTRVRNRQVSYNVI